MPWKSREKKRAYEKMYRRTAPAEVLARRREYSRRYYMEHRTELICRRLAAYHADPEKWCARSSAWRARNKDRAKVYNSEGKRRRAYGLEPEAYARMLVSQGGRCKLCDGPATGPWKCLSLDHDHRTGQRRGLLCDRCNLGLGYFGDSVEMLERAARYLRNGSRSIMYFSRRLIDAPWYQDEEVARALLETDPAFYFAEEETDGAGEHPASN